MNQANWKVIPNKNLADIMIKVYGVNEEDLINNLIDAFLNIIVDEDKINSNLEYQLKITAGNLPDLIAEMIDKLIYLKDVKFLLFRSAKAKISYTSRGLSLYLLLSGQKIRPDFEIKTDIKALTMHKFRIKKVKGRYQADLVFDI